MRRATPERRRERPPAALRCRPTATPEPEEPLDMRRWQQIGIYGALLLAIACGPSNPLVGAWEPDQGKSDALAAAGNAL